jgi:eukaryotic-like serine/threonine-protein kinase
VSEEPAGEIIGARYVLETPIAARTNRQVWRAHHITLGTPVALKLFVREQPPTDRAKKQFVAAAQMLASLKAEHAAELLDFGFSDDGMPFVVTDLIEGETLRARLDQSKRLPASETVAVLSACAKALDRAHATGIVHRDFKPENVMFQAVPGSSEEVIVIDFGIAKLIADLDGRASMPIGTARYLAPEQAANSPDIGPPADVWALGVVAYECLTGASPFEGETEADVLKNISEGQFVSPRDNDPAIAPSFEAWFRIACAPVTIDRYNDPLTAIAQLAKSLGVDEITVTSKRQR